MLKLDKGWLEPSVSKGTRWVLRRERRSNPPDLSDLIFERNKEDIEAIHDILQDYLDKRGLILAEDKSGFTTTYDGFEFFRV